MCAVLDQIEEASDEMLLEEANKAVNRHMSRGETKEDDWHARAIRAAVTKCGSGDDIHTPVTELMHTADRFARGR